MKKSHSVCIDRLIDGFSLIRIVPYSQLRCVVGPVYLFLRNEPSFAVVGIALIEEVGTPVLVRKQMGVSALTAVPFARLAVGLEGLVAQAGEVDAVLTVCNAYLLRAVVVGSCIEHPHLAILDADAGPFNTFTFPRKFREKDALVCC